MNISGNGNLVLYKQKPALIISYGVKISIQTANNKQISVRPKDIILLHPGPVDSLERIQDRPLASDDLTDACEMLSGETSNIEEFCELAYGVWDPRSAMEVWSLLQEGVYLTGTPWEFQVKSRESVEEELQQREEKEQRQKLWQQFLTRVKEGNVSEEDHGRFFDVENLAYGKTASSRLLKELNIPDDAEHAHRLLLSCGIWDEYVNPYPSRYGFSLEQQPPALSFVDSQDRRDLTGIRAFAIDDEGNKDPDDAVSIDGDTFWVHVADPSETILPGSEADRSAADMGATLYLPEKTITMLHHGAAEHYGLGLQELSPALSFGFTVNEDGSLDDIEVCLSLVRVERLTYGEAQQQMDADHLLPIAAAMRRFRDRRMAQGAIELSLPEVRTRVSEDREISISSIVPFESRELVGNAMMAAGEAAARFALEQEIPFPFTSQVEPEGELPEDATLSQMYAFRRKLRPSSVHTSPSAHAGLGLPLYSRVTSPLRRYIDLLAHQQLRAYLTGRPMKGEEEILYASSTAFEQVRRVRWAERESNLHWKLVYLQQHPDWEGEGIVVELTKKYCNLVIPSLALDVQIPRYPDASLDDVCLLTVDSVRLPDRVVHVSCTGVSSS